MTYSHPGMCFCSLLEKMFNALQEKNLHRLMSSAQTRLPVLFSFDYTVLNVVFGCINFISVIELRLHYSILCPETKFQILQN